MSRRGVLADARSAVVDLRLDEVTPREFGAAVLDVVRCCLARLVGMLARARGAALRPFCKFLEASDPSRAI